MSKQLSAEWQRRISDEALAYSKDIHDRNDYEAGVISGSESGFIEAATVYATQLVEAQERVEKLEQALKAISKFEEAHWAANPDLKLTKIFKLSNEALLPDNTIKKEDA